MAQKLHRLRVHSMEEPDDQVQGAPGQAQGSRQQDVAAKAIRRVQRMARSGEGAQASEGDRDQGGHAHVQAPTRRCVLRLAAQGFSFGGLC